MHSPEQDSFSNRVVDATTALPNQAEQQPVSLEALREQIDEVDVRIMALLLARAGLVHDVEIIKKERGLPVRDIGREAELLGRVMTTTANLGVRNVFKTILDESRLAQGEEPPTSPGAKSSTRRGHW